MSAKTNEVSGELEAAADRILERFIFSRPARNNYGDKTAGIPLSEFGEIDAVGLWPDCISGRYEWFDPSAVPVTPGVIWPIDMAVASEFAKEPGSIGVIRAATVSPKELRGRAKIIPPHALRLQRAVLESNGTYWTEVAYAGFVGGQWRQIDADIKRAVSHTASGVRIVSNHGSSHHVAETHRWCGALMSLALSRRYEWTASIRLDDSPTLVFPTDALGIRELFRLRDKDEGKLRRSALLHWVCQHWRKKRIDPEAVSFVRKHVRGETAFRWAGFDCSIKPSLYDIEQTTKAA